MKSKYNYFSCSTKMADAILQNYSLLTILPRFSVNLGFGEKSIAEVSAIYNIDANFFCMILNIYTFDTYLPSAQELKNIDLDQLISYLKSSHIHYSTDKISAIEKKLSELESLGERLHFKMLNRFFLEYKQEIISHFGYEDSMVFPYILQLKKSGKIDGFNIFHYEENHSNIDDKLSDLTNIIIKYLPDNLSTQYLSELLIEIFRFEEDLEKHTRIEDKILIPYVREMEISYE